VSPHAQAGGCGCSAEKKKIDGKELTRTMKGKIKMRKNEEIYEEK